MATQSLSAVLIRRGLASVVKNGFEDITSFHTEFLNVNSGDGQYTEEAFHSELGAAVRIGDPGSQGLRDTVPRATFAMSPVVRAYFNRYGLAYDFIDDEADDDLYGVIRTVGTSLGKSMRYRMEVSAHDLLNNGEDGTLYPQGWEAAALYQASHGLLNSTSTVDNLLSGGGPSVASLANIFAYGETFLDDQGMPTPIRPSLLLTGTRNAYLWAQIMRSNTDVTQANSAVINPYEDIRVLGSQYLSNANDTYVFYEGHKDHMRMTMRRPPTVITWDDHDPERTITSIDARWVVFTTNNLRTAKVAGAV